MTRIKVPLILFILTAMALAGAAALLVPATFPDIEIARVSFSNTYSEGGETIDALLATPENPGEEPMPAVVFAHGLTANKEIYFSLWRDFARRGIAVLAIDLPGHGGSGGSSDLGRTEYTAMLAAYDWLVTEHPEIDPARVAAVGHSLGGISATRAGTFQPEPKFRAVAAIFCWQGDRAALEGLAGPIGDYVGRLWPLLIFSRDYDVNDPATAVQRDIISNVSPGTPPNYLVVIGDWDEFVTIQHEKELVAAAAGQEEIEPGVVYGSFENGTARMLVVTADDHATEIFSPWVFDKVYDWLCSSFGIERTGTMAIPALRFSLWVVLLGCVLLMALLFTIILFRLLEGRAASPHFLMLPDGSSTPARKREMVGGSIAWLCVTAFLAYPLAIWLGLTVLVPFLVGDLVSSLALVRGILTLAGAAAGLLLIYNMSNISAEIPWGEKARSMLWSAVPPLGGFALLLLLYVPLAHYLYLGQALPWNWGWFVLYAVLVTGLFWSEGRYFHLFLLPAFGELASRGRKLLYLVSEAALRTFAQMLVFLPFVIAKPWHIVGRAGSLRLPMLVVVALIAFPLYLVLAWINLYCRERKASLLLPSLGIALLQAWVLCALLCAR
jgi:pimeloyl-ACP methyl ester carboxylesterase